MKAIVQDRYGSSDVLRLQEIDRPTVGDDEVLVRVRAASMHPDVWHVMAGRPYILRLIWAGLIKPKKVVPGTDMAGVVEAVGKGVTRFQPGDAVFGDTLSGLEWIHGGTFAEYVAVKQERLAFKPENVTFEQAATLPTAGLIALNNLSLVRPIEPGHKVLINGAGGGVGAIALQLVKAYGGHVTAVDHTKKLDLVRSLGADRILDYTQTDFTQGSERYDLIFDIPGNHTFFTCRKVLQPEGTYILIGHEQFGTYGHRFLGVIPYALALSFLALFERRLPKMTFSLPNRQDSMATLKAFLEAGKLTPIIDRTYPLSEVPEAMRYMQQGTALGRIVITV